MDDYDDGREMRFPSFPSVLGGNAYEDSNKKTNVSK
jgi:hypothetical protein